MIGIVIHTTLRLARASWRGQLGVLILAVPLLGILLHGASDGAIGTVRLLLVFATLIVLVTGAARAATQPQVRPSRDALMHEGRAVASLAPRSLVQSFIAVFPAVVMVLAALGAARVHPLLGLVALPIAFVGELLVAPVVLLVTAAVVYGDEAWHPRAAFAAGANARWKLVATVLVGGVLLSLAALPFVLAGFVLGAVLGPVGWLGTGLAVAAPIPWLGCGACALWTSVGGRIAPVSARTDPKTGAAFSVASPRPAWVDGPAWQITVEPGLPWGTWLRLDAASAAAFRVAWSDGPAPGIALGSEVGEWMVPGELSANGGMIDTQMRAGNTYLRIDARGALPQHVAITMLLPRAIAA